MEPEKTKKKSEQIPHAMVGRQVWFKGEIWKVVSAHTGQNHGTPWLTLRRGLGIQALAKVHEVQEALN